MRYFRDVGISLAMGCFIATTGVFLTGYTAAIAMPSWLSSAIILWELLVVQFLGFGVISLLATFMLVRFCRVNSVVLVVLALLVILLLPNLWYGTPIIFYWPHAVTLLICLTVGCYLGFKNSKPLQ